MTWSLNASGHIDNADEERALVDRLREAFEPVDGSATFYGQYTSQVDLHEDAGPEGE